MKPQKKNSSFEKYTAFMGGFVAGSAVQAMKPYSDNRELSSLQTQGWVEGRRARDAASENASAQTGYYPAIIAPATRDVSVTEDDDAF